MSFVLSRLQRKVRSPVNPFEEGTTIETDRVGKWPESVQRERRVTRRADT